jgi:hypothetical protein
MELAIEIINHVRSYECTCLEYTKLAILLEFAINNEKVMKILKTTKINMNDTHCCFNIVYDKFTSHNKEFILMNEFESLALSWLFCLYH